MNHSKIATRLTRTFLAQPLLALLLLARFPAPAALEARAAQDPAAGLWEGVIDLPSNPLDFSLKLWREGQVWGGLISIPAQNLTDFPLQEVQVSNQTVSWAIKGLPGDPVFQGELADDGSAIAGELSQAGMAFPFHIERKGDAAPPEKPSSVDAEAARPFLGSWQGELEAPGQRLLIRLHINQNPQGVVEARVDSPDQGQSGLPVIRIEVDGLTLRLHLSYMAASFEGSLSEDGQQIVGAWKQGGAQLPLTVKAYRQ